MILFKDTIYQILGDVERDIIQSDTGYARGAVVVYIPHNRKGSFFSRIFRTSNLTKKN